VSGDKRHPASVCSSLFLHCHGHFSHSPSSSALRSWFLVCDSPFVHGWATSTPRRERNAGVVPGFFGRVPLVGWTRARPLVCLSRADGPNNVGDPPLALVVTHFQRRDESSNPGNPRLEWGDFVPQPVDFQHFQIGFQGAVPPPGSADHVHFVRIRQGSRAMRT